MNLCGIRIDRGNTEDSWRLRLRRFEIYASPRVAWLRGPGGGLMVKRVASMLFSDRDDLAAGRGVILGTLFVRIMRIYNETAS